MRKYLLIIAVVLPVVLLQCKTIQIDSHKLDRTITIDGCSSEWNNLIEYPEDTKFGIGVMNDDKYLYVCMVSWDNKVTAQILHRGFSTTFEAQKGNGKGSLLGIHFPMGMAKSEFHHGIDQDPQLMKEKIEESLQHIEILGPGKKDTCPTRTIIAESMGIFSKIAFTEGNCVYELKVPLQLDSINKFAINTPSTNPITMILETSAYNSEKMNNPADASSAMQPGSNEGAMGGGGGRGGMHSGGHGGGRGHSGDNSKSGSNSMSEPFKFSCTINLSTSK